MIQRILRELTEINGKRFSELTLKQKQLVELVSSRKPTNGVIWLKDAPKTALGISYYFKELLKAYKLKAKLTTFEDFHIIEDVEMNYEDLEPQARGKWDIPKFSQLEDCLKAWDRGVYHPHRQFQNMPNIPFYRTQPKSTEASKSLSSSKYPYMATGKHDAVFVDTYLPVDLLPELQHKLNNRLKKAANVESKGNWNEAEWISILTFYEPVKASAKKGYIQEDPKSNVFVLKSRNPDLQLYLQYDKPIIIEGTDLVSALENRQPVYSMNNEPPLEFLTKEEIQAAIKEYVKTSRDYAYLNEISKNYKMLGLKYGYEPQPTNDPLPQPTRMYTGEISDNLYEEALYRASKGEFIFLDKGEDDI